MKSELDSRFWLGNEAFLSGVVEKGSAMESQKRGLGSRPFVEKLFARNEV
jgi:hypothetical protein